VFTVQTSQLVSISVIREVKFCACTTGLEKCDWLDNGDFIMGQEHGVHGRAVLEAGERSVSKRRHVSYGLILRFGFSQLGNISAIREASLLERAGE
jgi:hypothetical protein